MCKVNFAEYGTFKVLPISIKQLCVLFQLLYNTETETQPFQWVHKEMRSKSACLTTTGLSQLSLEDCDSAEGSWNRVKSKTDVEEMQGDRTLRKRVQDEEDKNMRWKKALECRPRLSSFMSPLSPIPVSLWVHWRLQMEGKIWASWRDSAVLQMGSKRVWVYFLFAS